MEETIFYSIIVVCLNSGERLQQTIKSILEQSYSDYEIIVKDGGSTDGSVEKLPVDDRIFIYQETDKGIYDAMNQAITHAKGEYHIFLNTGDFFYDGKVLEAITAGILKQEAENGQKPDIVYGNLYNCSLDTVIYAAPKINDFTCYRNVPCHQTCFYHRNMFLERVYNPEYTVRADYEHFLWCYYKKKADIRYLPVMVAAYEGGGYSETPQNREKSARQHTEIVNCYMGRRKAWKYRMILLLTLAPLRRRLAESERFSKCYNAVKTAIYKK